LDVCDLELDEALDVFGADDNSQGKKDVESST
jgi:hypothetical protein